MNDDPRLRFHPLTGDPDFEEAPLSERLDRIIEHAKSEGFGEGFRAARADRCDVIVNNGMGEPTECGRTEPCEYHRAAPADLPSVEQEAAALDVERLARAMESAGYGDVTGDLDQYQEWGGSPRGIASKIAAEYLRLAEASE